MSGNPQIMGERSSPKSKPTATLTCDKCGRSFSRSEHLQRHIRSHTRERPYACTLCGKQFSRSDILRRHEAAHQPNGADKASRVVTASFRACVECATARVKCSGEKPCRRCLDRSIECLYPPKRRRRNSPKDNNNEIREAPTQNYDSIYPPLEAVPSLAPRIGSLDLVPGAQAAFKNNHIDTSSLSMPPNVDLSLQSWGNDSAQNPPDNLVNPQFEALISNESLLQVDPVFGEEWSSINWLPLGDESAFYDDWDAGNPTYGDLFVAAPGNMASINTGSDHIDIAISPNGHPSPANTMSGSVSESTHSALTDNTHKESRYYVNGDGARTAAKLDRQRSASKGVLSERDFSVSGDLTGNISVGSTTTSPLAGSNTSHYLVTPDTYGKILKNTNGISEFVLPPIETLNRYTQLYLDKFHPLFPLLHEKTFNTGEQAWMLVLATTAIGAVYSAASGHSEALHIALTRVLDAQSVSIYFETPLLLDAGREEEELVAIQARILNISGMLHSGNENLTKFAYSSRSVLVASVNRLNLLGQVNRDYLKDRSISRTAKQHRWRMEEWKLRTGYFIWMLDCMMACRSDFRPQLQLIDAKAPLPCPEPYWKDVEANWSKICESETTSLREATAKLYSEKKIAENIDELGRTLIIYAIYHKTWEVKNYHAGILSGWTPTAGTGDAQSVSTDTQNWTISIPIVSRWRNIACDVLDILHWEANSEIARAAGIEHPIVIHLHLARLVLLTPAIQLQELAFCIIHSSHENPATSYAQQSNSTKEMEARKELLRWVVQDHFKSRLAIIHAGALYWNVRRYRYGSTIEPFAIYLATLVIWAYGFVNSGLQREELQRQAERASGSMVTTAEKPLEAPMQESSPSNYPVPISQLSNPTRQLDQLSLAVEPSFLHLDRPIDDELVQLFVKEGNKMTGYMVHIGDIRGPDAAVKVLREGARLLTSGVHQPDMEDAAAGGTWGLADKYAHQLQALANISEAKQGRPAGRPAD